MRPAIGPSRCPSCFFRLHNCGCDEWICETCMETSWNCSCNYDFEWEVEFGMSDPEWRDHMVSEGWQPKLQGRVEPDLYTWVMDQGGWDFVKRVLTEKRLESPEKRESLSPSGLCRRGLFAFQTMEV